VASLQARASLRSAHPLSLLANKLVSLTLFIALLCGGFVALNYLRTEMQGRTPHSEKASVPLASVTETSAHQPAVVQKLSAAPTRLVYSCPSDSSYYHALTHLQHCKRTALSEDAALARGLKRCPICLPN
jgi:hypothetical protein